MDVNNTLKQVSKLRVISISWSNLSWYGIIRMSKLSKPCGWKMLDMEFVPWKASFPGWGKLASFLWSESNLPKTARSQASAQRRCNHILRGAVTFGKRHILDAQKWRFEHKSPKKTGARPNNAVVCLFLILQCPTSFFFVWVGRFWTCFCGLESCFWNLEQGTVFEAGNIIDSKVLAGSRGYGFLPRIGLISNSSFFPFVTQLPGPITSGMIRPSYQYRKNKLSFFWEGRFSFPYESWHLLTTVFSETTGMCGCLTSTSAFRDVVPFSPAVVAGDGVDCWVVGNAEVGANTWDDPKSTALTKVNINTSVFETIVLRNSFSIFKVSHHEHKSV